MEDENDGRLFSFGVIADIQYAPIPDGTSYSGRARYYKHALTVAEHAFQHFQDEKVDLVVNLGDTIDGKCQEVVLNGGDPLPEGKDPGLHSIDEVLEALSRYEHGSVIHTYGNHCLYNLDRPTLSQKLGIPFIKEPCGDLVGYFHHQHKGFRFVVLDSYDIAMMQRCETSSQKRAQATEILKQNNPNFEGNMNSPEGMEGTDRRFVGFGGAIGNLQLEWLRQTLEDARNSSEKVIVLSHQPITPESTNPICLIWNYDEVLQVLQEYSDTVIASFSGHAHKGGYVHDADKGIHYRVFEAVLESMPERTYAIVHVYEDRLDVQGFGDCESASYNI